MTLTTAQPAPPAQAEPPHLEAVPTTLSEAHRKMLDALALGATYEELNAAGLPWDGCALTNTLQALNALRGTDAAKDYNPWGEAKIVNRRGRPARRDVRDRDDVDGLTRTDAHTLDLYEAS